jgi:hypothetical protein
MKTYRIVVIPGARPSVAVQSAGRPTRHTATASLFPRSVFGIRKGVANISGELRRTFSIDGRFGKKKVD